MKLTHITMALLAGTACAAALAAPMTTAAEHDAALKSAAAAYKTAKAACDALKGNAKDICVEEAKGHEKVAKAEADAAYKGTPKAQADVHVAQAEATYRVAKEKCDDLSGNPKDVCVKEANAAYTKAKADAKVERVTGDARQDATTATAAVRRDAADEKREADYKVAIEKCDALAGSAKDRCVRDAQARYGHS